MEKGELRLDGIMCYCSAMRVYYFIDGNGLYELIGADIKEVQLPFRVEWQVIGSIKNPYKSQRNKKWFI